MQSILTGYRYLHDVIVYGNRNGALMTDFRNRVRGRQPTAGTFLAIPHPVAVEVTARAGLDFVCIDWEHSQIGRERIEDLVRAAEVAGAPAIVRVPGHAAEPVAAALDAGAAGVLVPRVSSADEAREAVSAVRYPPVGARGAGPGRASRYGYDIAGYIAKANASLLLAVQVETAAGVDNIEAIASVEEVDLVFIGPGDLSVSLGAFGPEGKDRLEAAITRVVEACSKAGKAVGIFRPDAGDIERWRKAGISFFVIGSDTMFLGAAAAACVSAVAAITGGSANQT